MIANFSPDALNQRVVGRTASLFSADVAANRERIASQIAGCRVLVVGGGGSIGSHTVRRLLHYGPSAVHLMDHNENALAELVRDLRNGADHPDGVGLRMWPIDFGGPIAERLVYTEPAYDIVLNFAAVKHVRSEKDVYSLLQMVDTNVVRQARFKRWIASRGGTTRFFGVSTDKAANPTSLMGATKRLMEDVLFGVGRSGSTTVTSARFANVAFSNGSLLQAWQRRIELGQPLAVPENTRRYFVTQPESGEICLLAALLGASEEIFIPRLDPAKELRLLEDVAVSVLDLYGFEAVLFRDEAEARAGVAVLRNHGKWPLLVTPLDTSGEKPYEEFTGAGEAAHDVGMTSVLAVTHAVRPDIEGVVHELEHLIASSDRAVTKAGLVAELMSAVPGLRHAETGRTLDERM